MQSCFKSSLRPHTKQIAKNGFAILLVVGNTWWLKALVAKSPELWQKQTSHMQG
jgi:hypothetical protein